MLALTDLTNDQQLSLDKVRDAHRSGRMETRLDGFAGTGKTTLINLIPGHLDLGYRDVLCVTTTGRARRILKSKTKCLVLTIAQAFFQPVPVHTDKSLVLQERLDSDVAREIVLFGSRDYVARKLEVEDAKRIGFEERLSPAAAEASLIIIDEHSMISLTNRDVMSKAGRPILAVGDPFQLPPVDYSINEQMRPDYVEGRMAYHDIEPLHVLTEVVRVGTDEAGRNILEAASATRKGLRLLPTDKPGLTVRNMNLENILWDQPMLHHLFERDVVIAGKHSTRQQLTRAMRSTGLGADNPQIVEGDRLLVTRNSPQLGLVNGDILHVDNEQVVLGEVVLEGMTYPTLQLHDIEVREALQHWQDLQVNKDYYQGKETRYVEVALPDFAMAVFEPSMLSWPYGSFKYEKARDFATEATKRLSRIKLKVGWNILCLEFGHVITCHKAQGSEFANIAVIDDGWSRTAELSERWAYTALTRATRHCLYLKTYGSASMLDSFVMGSQGV